MSPIRLKRNATRSKKRLLGEVVVLVLVVDDQQTPTWLNQENISMRCEWNHQICGLTHQQEWIREMLSYNQYECGFWPIKKWEWINNFDWKQRSFWPNKMRGPTNNYEDHLDLNNPIPPKKDRCWPTGPPWQIMAKCGLCAQILAIEPAQGPQEIGHLKAGHPQGFPYAQSRKLGGFTLRTWKLKTQYLLPQ